MFRNFSGLHKGIHAEDLVEVVIEAIGDAQMCVVDPIHGYMYKIKSLQSRVKILEELEKELQDESLRLDLRGGSGEPDQVPDNL